MAVRLGEKKKPWLSGWVRRSCGSKVGVEEKKLWLSGWVRRICDSKVGWEKAVVVRLGEKKKLWL